MEAGLFVLVFLGFVLGGFVLWLWSLIDAVQVPDDSIYRSGTKLIWVLIIVLTGPIGSLVYLGVGRPDRAPAR